MTWFDFAKEFQILLASLSAVLAAIVSLLGVALAQRRNRQLVDRERELSAQLRLEENQESRRKKHERMIICLIAEIEAIRRVLQNTAGAANAQKLMIKLMTDEISDHDASQQRMAPVSFKLTIKPRFYEMLVADIDLLATSILPDIIGFYAAIESLSMIEESVEKVDLKTIEMHNLFKEKYSNHLAALASDLERRLKKIQRCEGDPGSSIGENLREAPSNRSDNTQRAGSTQKS